MTITKSPVSIPGVKIGLFFPNKRLATLVANRPKFWPSASTTTHCGVTFPAFGTYVFCTSISPLQTKRYVLFIKKLHINYGMYSLSNVFWRVDHLNQGQPVRWGCSPHRKFDPINQK